MRSGKTVANSYIIYTVYMKRAEAVQIPFCSAIQMIRPDCMGSNFLHDCQCACPASKFW